MVSQEVSAADSGVVPDDECYSEVLRSYCAAGDAAEVKASSVLGHCLKTYNICIHIYLYIHMYCIHIIYIHMYILTIYIYIHTDIRTKT